LNNRRDILFLIYEIKYLVLHVPTKNQYEVSVGMTAVEEIGKRKKRRDKADRNKGNDE
jgi:hypothetical protein